MSRDSVEIFRKITLQNKEYPAILKEIHDKPKEFYIKGNYVLCS